MEVKITHLDQVKFAIHSRSHSILCDQPAENGGKDSGMTPPEFLLASLGSCAAFYAVQYLRTRNLDDTWRGSLRDCREAEAACPARQFPHPCCLPCARSLKSRTKGLMRSVHHCLVHNTLLTPPEIEIELAVGEAALQQWITIALIQDLTPTSELFADQGFRGRTCRMMWTVF